jgi:hypothetical protein
VGLLAPPNASIASKYLRGFMSNTVISHLKQDYRASGGKLYRKGFNVTVTNAVAKIVLADPKMVGEHVELAPAPAPKPKSKANSKASVAPEPAKEPADEADEAGEVE